MLSNQTSINNKWVPLLVGYNLHQINSDVFGKATYQLNDIFSQGEKMITLQNIFSNVKYKLCEITI
jgi:hypothetical protein